MEHLKRLFTVKDEKMKKKSVFFVLPDLHAGGAERIVTTIANNLPREKFSPAIMLLRKEGPYLDFLKDDVEVIDLKTQRIRNALWPIFREIRRRKPDVVFCGFGEINAYMAPFVKLFPKTKFIARETNVVSQHVTRKEIRFFYRFYNNFDQIICQSDDMLEDLISQFNVQRKKTIKINNPVDIDFIDEKLSNALKPSVYKEGFKNVLAIGNLSHRKGFDNLLRVFDKLKTENILLHIVGEGRDREQLLQLKQQLGLNHVLFHGVQNNPYPYLKYADLFVLSSRYEGFPNVLLEAGACGCYALVNRCKGGIEEIIQPGINGEIADIEDAEVFAHKIKETLEGSYDPPKMRAHIKDNFSKEIILKKYESIF